MGFILFLLLILLAIVVWAGFIINPFNLSDEISYWFWRMRHDQPGKKGWIISELDPLFAPLALDLYQEEYFVPEEMMRRYEISRERCERLEQELYEFGLLEDVRPPKQRRVLEMDSLIIERRLYDMGWIPRGVDDEVYRMLPQDLIEVSAGDGFYQNRMAVDVLHKLGCIGRYVDSGRNSGYVVLIDSEKKAQEKIALLRDIYSHIPKEPKKE